MIATEKTLEDIRKIFGCYASDMHKILLLQEMQTKMMYLNSIYDHGAVIDSDYHDRMVDIGKQLFYIQK